MIAILMATYNGEKYLAEQVASILRQTEQGFTLHIRDDASTDGTLAIAQRYAAAHPGRISVSVNDENTGSSKDNFLRMIAETQDEYVMLCDQDDMWLDTKVEDTLRFMRGLEAEHGRDVPLLVHTDLRVVDAGLQEIAPSFWAYSGIDGGRTQLEGLAMRNVVTGCTVMINRALAQQVQKMPAYCVMHDWWLALVAAGLGHMGAMPEATVLYRQHGENVVGAKQGGTLAFKVRRLLSGGQVRQDLRDTYRQAGCFAALYGDRLTEAQRAFLRDYAAIGDHWKGKRIREMIRLGTWQGSLSRCIGQVLFG